MISGGQTREGDSGVDVDRLRIASIDVHGIAVRIGLGSRGGGGDSYASGGGHTDDIEADRVVLVREDSNTPGEPSGNRAVGRETSQLDGVVALGDREGAGPVGLNGCPGLAVESEGVSVGIGLFAGGGDGDRELTGRRRDQILASAGDPRGQEGQDQKGLAGTHEPPRLNAGGLVPAVTQATAPGYGILSPVSALNQCSREGSSVNPTLVSGSMLGSGGATNSHCARPRRQNSACRYTMSSLPSGSTTSTVASQVALARRADGDVVRPHPQYRARARGVWAQAPRAGSSSRASRRSRRRTG